MAVDKAAMLAAIAQAGSQGKADYETAQAQMAAQQQSAIQAALANGLARNAPAGAQAELANIVGGGYRGRQAQLTSNQATSQDWFNRTGANAGLWGDVLNPLMDAVTARAQIEAAGGGGSGGGGGGSGKGDEPLDWYSNLKDLYGTSDNAKTAIAGIANDWHTSGVSNREASRRYAQSLGIPAELLNEYGGSPDTEFGAYTNQQIAGAKNPRGARKALAQVRGSARAAAESAPGQYNTGYYVNQAKTALRGKFGKKARPSGKQVNRSYRNAQQKAK